MGIKGIFANSWRAAKTIGAAAGLVALGGYGAGILVIRDRIQSVEDTAQDNADDVREIDQKLWNNLSFRVDQLQQDMFECRTGQIELKRNIKDIYNRSHRHE